MIIKAEGLKAWLLILVLVLGTFVILSIIFHILLFLLPIILMLLLMGYLFRKLNAAKSKKKRKDFIDVEFNVRK